MKSEFCKVKFVSEFIIHLQSFQLILLIWTLFIHLKTLNTIGRHVPNVLVTSENDLLELKLLTVSEILYQG